MTGRGHSAVNSGTAARTSLERQSGEFVVDALSDWQPV